MTELEQIQDSINNALNYLKNQDLTEVGRQAQGKLINAKTQVENLILHSVIVGENCNKYNKEIIHEIMEVVKKFNYIPCCKSDIEQLCDCKKHSINTNYGFQICTKCGNEFDD